MSPSPMTRRTGRPMTVPVRGPLPRTMKTMASAPADLAAPSPAPAISSSVRPGSQASIRAL